MEENEIASDENFRGGSKNLGFKEIVLSQVIKIATIGSREQKQGFMVFTQPIQGFNVEQTPIRYIGDTRKEYICAVEVLYDLLQPKFDEKMIKASEDWLKKLKLQTKINNKRICMRKLFQELCKFLERLGWLSPGEVIE